MAMHPVEVDHEAIDRVFLLYISQAGPEPDQVQEGDYIPADDGTESDWRDMSDVVVMMAADRYVPAWQVDEDRQIEVSKKICVILDKYLPGGPPNLEAWGPFAQLVFSVGTVCVMDGFDWQSFSIKPRRPDKEGEGEPDQADTGQTYQAQKTKGGKFTTEVDNNDD